MNRLHVAILTLLTFALAGCEPPATDLKPAPDKKSAAADSQPKAAAPESRRSAITLEPVDVAGYEAAVKKHHGKVVLVDFWATWCIPCRAGFPHTVELSRKYAGDGLSVISLSMDDLDSAKERALEFLTKQKAEFTNLISTLEVGPEAFTAFDIDGGAVPHYRLYNREGQLIKRFNSDGTAQIGAAEVEAAVRAALDLKPQP